MNINIREQFRPDFDKSADFTIEQGEVTPSQLAEYLGRGRLSAEMMVRYMESAELITKGKGDEVRYARITLEEWEAIGRSIENYQPVPEKEETPEEAKVTVDDIITDKIEFIGKTLRAEGGSIIISDGKTETAVSLQDIRTIYLHKGFLFAKSTMTFSCDGEKPNKARLRDDTVVFRRKDFEIIKKLAGIIASRLEAEVKIY